MLSWHIDQERRLEFDNAFNEAVKRATYGGRAFIEVCDNGEPVTVSFYTAVKIIAIQDTLGHSCRDLLRNCVTSNKFDFDCLMVPRESRLAGRLRIITIWCLLRPMNASVAFASALIAKGTVIWRTAFQRVFDSDRARIRDGFDVNSTLDKFEERGDRFRSYVPPQVAKEGWDKYIVEVSYRLAVDLQKWALGPRLNMQHLDAS